MDDTDKLLHVRLTRKLRPPADFINAFPGIQPDPASMDACDLRAVDSQTFGERKDPALSNGLLTLINYLRRKHRRQEVGRI
jgi:hypothetical protein